MNAQELQRLLADVTPGNWWASCDDCMEWHIHNDSNVIVARVSDARLIALAPTLARRVIELESALRRLVNLNEEYTPFGGEAYQDRVERGWDKARSALADHRATQEVKP